MRAPRAPHRMAQADAAPVHVGDVTIEAEFLLAADVLACKGLVQLDELEAVKIEIWVSLQEVFDCRNRAKTHDRGVACHRGRMATDAVPAV